MDAVEFDRVSGTLAGGQRAVARCGRDFLDALEVAGERGQRLIGQVEVSGRAVGVGGIDLRQAVRPGERAQPRSDDGVVRRTGELLLTANLRLEVLRAAAQVADAQARPFVEGARAVADQRHRSVHRMLMRVSKISEATCMIRPEAWNACW